MPLPRPTRSLLAPVMDMLSKSPQQKLVARLSRRGAFKSEEVANVLNAVDRKNYISRDPYEDRPQGIGCEQTISAPHMHAHALELMLPFLLDKQEPLKILDCGCGSGYLTAALGRWLQPTLGDEPILPKSVTGTVYGMDIFPELVDLTRQNLLKSDEDLLEAHIIHLKVGNGWKGWPEAAPFDAIHVGAAAEILPKKLAKQLKVGGVMIIPLGPRDFVQTLVKIERVAETGNFDTDFTREPLLAVRYVPFIEDAEMID